MHDLVGMRASKRVAQSMARAAMTCAAFPMTSFALAEVFRAATQFAAESDLS